MATRHEPFVKDVRQRPDERRSGLALAAFDGRGVVRLIEDRDGILLIERLAPGTPLSQLVIGNEDDEATRILADVIARMNPDRGAAFPTVHDWSLGFDRYLAGADQSVPRPLVVAARDTYLALCVSQTRTRLLHGDLHHDNVLFDRRRGWVAIDPKGVIGEVEYEVGAALRNPWECVTMVGDEATIARRARIFADVLRADLERILAWSFAQAVLAALWVIEDGGVMPAGHPLLLHAAQAARLTGVSF